MVIRREELRVCHPKRKTLRAPERSLRMAVCAHSCAEQAPSAAPGPQKALKTPRVSN